jgi:peptidylprolyl isomerase
MRNSPCVFSFVLLLLAAPVRLHAGGLDAEVLQGILRAQDQRDVASLKGFMVDSDEHVRSASVMAAASLQDTMLLTSLVDLLKDPAPDVRSAAALALGQLTPAVTDVQRASLSSALLGRLSSEQDANVQRRIFEAIGKAGNPAALEEMIRIADGLDAALRSEAALSVGRFGYRALRSVSGSAFAANGLSENTDETWKSAYALMRIGVDSLLRPYLPAMKRAFGGGDPNTRMFLATALGATRSPDAIAVLMQAAATDPDWRVRVNATRALALVGKNDSAVVGAILRLTADPNEHVSLTALTALRTVDTVASMRAILADFLNTTEKRISVSQSGEAAKTFALVYGTRSSRVLSDAYTRGTVTGEVYAECLGSFDDPGSFAQILDFTKSTDVPTARAALNALDAIVRRSNDPQKRKVARSVYLASLQSDDMTILVIAAGMLGDSLYADVTVEQPLLDRLDALSPPEDVESMISIVQALGTLKSKSAISSLEELLNSSDPSLATEAAKSLDLITGKTYVRNPPRRPPVHTDYDWEFLKNLHGVTVVVETSAGTFSFALLPDEAPFTCMNFSRLIQDGFYDGLRFHRVVPNFVIQGGDPRGDGWGGPGYSIRSEFGLENYDAGMVGVASSGKDTEGCQFFVTHSKQPHLDGRYTIFGRIVDGMDVVNRIQIGDVITRMKMVGLR